MSAAGVLCCEGAGAGSDLVGIMAYGPEGMIIQLILDR